jgi:hypothetical protein
MRYGSSLPSDVAALKNDVASLLGLFQVWIVPDQGCAITPQAHLVMSQLKFDIGWKTW